MDASGNCDNVNEEPSRKVRGTAPQLAISGSFTAQAILIMHMSATISSSFGVIEGFVCVVFKRSKSRPVSYGLPST